MQGKAPGWSPSGYSGTGTSTTGLGGSCLRPPDEVPQGCSWDWDQPVWCGAGGAGSGGWLTWALAVLKAKSSGTAFSRAAAKKVLTGPRQEPAKP